MGGLVVWKVWMFGRFGRGDMRLPFMDPVSVEFGFDPPGNIMSPYMLITEILKTCTRKMTCICTPCPKTLGETHLKIFENVTKITARNTRK